MWIPDTLPSLPIRDWEIKTARLHTRTSSASKKRRQNIIAAGMAHVLAWRCRAVRSFLDNTTSWLPKPLPQLPFLWLRALMGSMAPLKPLPTGVSYMVVLAMA